MARNPDFWLSTGFPIKLAFEKLAGNVENHIHMSRDAAIDRIPGTRCKYRLSSTTVTLKLQVAEWRVYLYKLLYPPKKLSSLAYIFFLKEENRQSTKPKSGFTTFHNHPIVLARNIWHYYWFLSHWLKGSLLSFLSSTFLWIMISLSRFHVPEQHELLVQIYQASLHSWPLPGQSTQHLIISISPVEQFSSKEVIKSPFPSLACVYRLCCLIYFSKLALY